MEYAIKKLPKSEVEIKVTVPDEKLTIFRKKAAEEISRDIHIKGFRPGNVPPHILEQYVDAKVLTGHAQQLAIQQTYAEVVVKEKISVVSRPKIKIEQDSPLIYTATVAILPDVEIKDHQSIKIKKEEVKVTSKEVDEILTDMQKYGTTYQDVDRPAQKNDRVEIDFEGFNEKGEPAPNTKSSNHPVIIGSGSLIPGFEDNLIGLKKDEQKEFEITFPKDYGKKDFQGKKLKFKVAMKRIEEGRTPALNDDFVEKMTGKKQTVDQFKSEIETNIKARKEEEVQIKRENDYIAAVLDQMKVELPDTLIDEEVENILQDIKDDIEKKGMEFTKFLEKVKTGEDDLRKKYRTEAERRLKVRLALQHLMKEEKIEVSSEELTQEFEKVKALYPQNQQSKIQEEFDSGHMKNQLLNRLSLRKFFAKVLA